jgi:hypothetical protein
MVLLDDHILGKEAIILISLNDQKNLRGSVEYIIDGNNVGEFMKHV